MTASARLLTTLRLGACALLFATTFSSQAAQTAAPPAPPLPAVADTPVSPAKQALVDQLLTLWHPESVALVMVQRPAADAVQQSRIAMQGRVSAEKQEATMKAISADAQRYIDEATPIAQAAAAKAVPQTAGKMLAQQFSEDELKQLIALLQSPVKHKFEQLVPQLERAVGDKVATDAGPQVQPKLDTMKQAIATKLRTAAMVP
ncbi:DUF2059 domain-containing protein [Ideonella azotifigens]|uniref:DUF2059 domain-containing protein n=1 Tax=Ideonella azotifigens TaxID=513160 RepID=A0ABN1K9Y0_9BURK|nr:DUF2059 domain-containing protein [Ideonella azotifigens]MCD2338955.1 DUF2059 domain-containing protein [Ideonella azotifigens]